MRQTVTILLLSFFSFPLLAQQWNPERYTVYYADTPILIDGLADSIWEQTPWSSDFVDIEGDKKPVPEHRTRVKMLWDQSYLYVYAYMDEPHVWAKLKKRDTVVFYDDDFEVFIDPDGDSHYYTEIEVNPLNTVWDLMLAYPYRVDHRNKVFWNWDIRELKTAVHIDGTLNDPSDIDKGWALEMAIPLNVLNEFAGDSPAADGNMWRINFSRVDWEVNNIDNYPKKKDSEGKVLAGRNWSWSPQGEIAMHMPEEWGYILFKKQEPRLQQELFELGKDEYLKRSMWDMYHLFQTHYKNNGTYLGTDQLLMNRKKSCSNTWSLEATSRQFNLMAKSCEDNKTWIINELGKIEKINVELDR